MKYTAYYCEENIWHLAADRREAGLSSAVALITNPDRSCALWNQRAARKGQPVLWDYHVVLLAAKTAAEPDCMVWDLDTRLGLPVRLVDYVAETFAPPGVLEPRFEPRFRVIEGNDWLAEFSSDRAHMRDQAGRYRKPPPVWPPIILPGRPNFLSWLDADSEGPGQWMTLEGFSRGTVFHNSVV